MYEVQCDFSFNQVKCGRGKKSGKEDEKNMEQLISDYIQYNAGVMQLRFENFLLQALNTNCWYASWIRAFFFFFFNRRFNGNFSKIIHPASFCYKIADFYEFLRKIVQNFHFTLST